MNCILNRDLTRRVKPSPAAAWTRKAVQTDLQLVLKLIKYGLCNIMATVTECLVEPYCYVTVSGILKIYSSLPTFFSSIIINNEREY